MNVGQEAGIVLWRHDHSLLHTFQPTLIFIRPMKVTTVVNKRTQKQVNIKTLQPPVCFPAYDPPFDQEFQFLSSESVGLSSSQLNLSTISQVFRITSDGARCHKELPLFLPNRITLQRAIKQRRFLYVYAPSNQNTSLFPRFLLSSPCSV
jgi:hypothetical protein